MHIPTSVYSHPPTTTLILTLLLPPLKCKVWINHQPSALIPSSSFFILQSVQLNTFAKGFTAALVNSGPSPFRLCHRDHPGDDEHITHINRFFSISLSLSPSLSTFFSIYFSIDYRIICYQISLLISPPLGSICFSIPLLYLLVDYTIYIYHDSGIRIVSTFLRILGVAHVNPCQSPSKPCHRNDPGDDESTSC